MAYAEQPRSTAHLADELIITDIPGTVHIIDMDGSMRGIAHDKSLKDVVLYPVPSSNPEDPLNWSPRRKWMNSLCLQLYTFMIAGATATGYSVYPQVIEHTGVSLSTLNSAVGVMFLMFGWGCLIWNSIALQYGRRGIYILSTLAAMCFTLWAPYTTSSGAWYAHRFFLGFFGAPVEALVEQSMSDMFFVHERGLHIGLFMLWLGGSSFLFPLAAGFVAENMDWKWCYYFPAIFLGVTAVILFFFMDETMYDRAIIEEYAEQAGRIAEPLETVTPTEIAGHDDGKNPIKSEKSGDDSSTSAGITTIYDKPTLWTKYRLWTVVKGKPNHIYKAVIRPLQHMWNFPVMTMSGFQYGTYLMLFTVMNGTWTTILQGDPYNFSTEITGTAYIAPFIGALVGSVYVGKFADMFHLRMARRNGGIREPEQRLWLYLASTIAMLVGQLLWGVGAAHGIHWIGPLIGVFLNGFAGVVSGAIPIAYISESYPELLGEGMITMTIIRNTMGFAAGYAVTPWLEAMGLQNTFITVALLSLGCSSLYYPFIYFGKAERRRTVATYKKYAATALIAH